MNRDLYNNLGINSSTVPAVRTATTNGTAKDTQGAESAAVIAHVGAPGDTLSGSVYIEFEVQESADNSTWTAAADASLYNPVGTANGATNTGCFALVNSNAKASKLYADGYIGIARYIRIVERRTGTHTTGTPTSSVIVLGNLDYRPNKGNAS